MKHLKYSKLNVTDTEVQTLKSVKSAISSELKATTKIKDSLLKAVEEGIKDIKAFNKALKEVVKSAGQSDSYGRNLVQYVTKCNLLKFNNKLDDSWKSKGISGLIKEFNKSYKVDGERLFKKPQTSPSAPVKGAKNKAVSQPLKEAHLSKKEVEQTLLAVSLHLKKSDDESSLAIIGDGLNSILYELEKRGIKL